MKLKKISFKHYFVALTLATIISPSSIAATGKEQPLDRIAAIVDDNVITVNQLNRQVEQIRNQIRAQNTMLPPSNILLKQVLEREIIKQLQLQMARNTGIFIDDNALNNTIENIAAQNRMDIRQFRDTLASEGYDFETFREDIRKEMIVARLQQREVNSRVTITEQELESFIATQLIQGQSNVEFNISHILISVPEASTANTIDEKRQKAEKILAELRKGADFAQSAISHSDGQQALKGGELGWRKAGELPALFARVLPQLNKNDVSDLIRSPSGFHIIKLVDKRQGDKRIITQTHSRHILLKPNEITSELEVINRLKQLRQRIESGDSFEELARSNSEDPVSASQGGSLGWMSPGELVPQFEAVMNQLKKNEISEPFQTPFGWHIVEVLERRNLDNSEEYMRRQAQEQIRQRKIEEARETWVRQLRNEAFVEVKLDDAL